MNEAIIILMNMRGGCATVDDKVHALFRLNRRSRKAEPKALVGEDETCPSGLKQNAEDEIVRSR